MKRWSRRLIYGLVMLVVSLLALELAASLWVRFRWRLDREGIEAQYRAAAEIDGVHVGARWMRTHPLFGFVSNGEGANNMGFIDPHDFPYRRQRGDFVIGFFGGSVAQQLAMAAQRDHFAERLARDIPSLRGRSVVILDFALGCAKQPQQFAIYNYFLETFDLSVNVDGFNEIAFNAPRVPVAYPCFAESLFGPSPRQVAMLQELRDTRDAQVRLVGESALAPLFRRSALFFMWWRGRTTRLENRARQLNRALESAGSSYLQDARLDGRDPQADGAQSWLKYTRLQLEIARAEGKRALFVLQPNLHDRGSKPLTPEEEQLQRTGAKQYRSDGIAAAYRKLREDLARTRPLGDALHDETGLFQQVTRQLYVDDCCHLNPDGNALLLERVASLLIEELTARPPPRD